MSNLQKKEQNVHHKNVPLINESLDTHVLRRYGPVFLLVDRSGINH